MYRALLLKPGTNVYVNRPGFGLAGTITRVMPQNGMYRVDTSSDFHHVKVSEHRIETYTDRRGY
jgi:hypothetical protein